jgi:3-dehydroquinate synthase
MMDIRVNLGPRSYDIAIRSADFAGFRAFVRERARTLRAFVITDKTVFPHAEKLTNQLVREGFHVELASLRPGEETKSLDSAAHLYDLFAGGHLDRKSLIVAVGGGVIGDLAGFAAATWVRGLSLLMVPTTLLAMVDSSVGGKVGVNHHAGKNLIGAFHQPVGVWIETAYLNTLPPREFRSGLAEVVKYGVILDPEFFIYLENHVDEIKRRDPTVIRHLIGRSCRLKADVVERDEREESGLRAVLNYGHTFAHAFETVGGYGKWLHGEAVAAGIVCASRLAERRRLIDHAITERQRELLEEFGLPTAPLVWDIDELIHVMRSDKKAVAGRMRFVLPKRLGEVALFDDVPEADVREVLEEMIPSQEPSG